MNDPLSQVHLRQTTPADLEHLFAIQLDREGGYLAAFLPEDHANRATYLEKHARLLKDPSVNYRTILHGTVIAGSISKFVLEGQAEITYWLDRSCWGQGIATRALRDFLHTEPARPLYGRVAVDNVGSQRVLTKCGFVKIGTDRGFARARQAVIEEYIYTLTH